MLSAYYWKTYSSYHLLFLLQVKGCLHSGILLKLPYYSSAPFRCCVLPVLQTPGSKQLHPTRITNYKTAGFVWSAAAQLQQVLLSTSNSTEWLSRASMPSVCCGAGALFCCVSRRLQTLLLSAGCTVLEKAAIVHSETRAFPSVLSVLVLHRSNVNILYPSAGTELRFGSCLWTSKIGDPDVWGSILFDLSKEHWVYGLEYNR